MAYPYQSYQNPYQQGYYPMYQQPQYQQPIQQTVQPQTQSYSPAINQSGIIWISGESEAAMYPIAPNGRSLARRSISNPLTQQASRPCASMTS